MPNLFTRLLLFFSSYFPLAVIFFLINRNKTPARIILGLGILGVVGLLVFLWRAQKLAGLQLEIESVQHRDSEAMAYIVSYIIPFIEVLGDSQDRNVALAIFFVVLAVLYVNSNLIHINPMLNLMGYHLYEVTVSDGGTHAVIAKRRISRGEVLSAVRVGEAIYLEKRHAQRSRKSPK